MADWNPAQYERFKDERSRPYFDLLDMVQPRPGLNCLDLGCGTGELTAQLHTRLGAKATLGIDSSPAMLSKAAAHAAPGLAFAQGDIATFAPQGAVDLVFSNAALHWLPDHTKLLARIAGWLGPQGQLAVQVPANNDHASHRVAHEVAARPEFATAMQGYVRQWSVLAPEAYSTLLHGLGFSRQLVRLQVYLHVLDSADAVVEWVKGTLLTDYEKRLGPALFASYLKQYQAALRAVLGDQRPYPYAFKRVLFWAMR